MTTPTTRTSGRRDPGLGWKLTKPLRDFTSLHSQRECVVEDDEDRVSILEDGNTTVVNVGNENDGSNGGIDDVVQLIPEGIDATPFEFDDTMEKRESVVSKHPAKPKQNASLCCTRQKAVDSSVHHRALCGPWNDGLFRPVARVHRPERQIHALHRRTQQKIRQVRIQAKARSYKSDNQSF